MPKNQSNRRRLSGVSIRSEQREQIDWDLFAWALLQYCRRKLEDEETGGDL